MTTTCQSGRDALLSMLQGKTATITPLYDAPWGDTMRKWVDQGYPTNEEGKPLPATEHFGFDMTNAGGWFNWLAHREREEIVEETEEWKLVRNGNGALLRWWKQRSGTPEHVDFHMTSREIWEEEYRPALLDDGRERAGDVSGKAEAIARERAAGRWVGYGHMFIWEMLRASLGDENMMMALIEDPDWIHDFCRVYTDLYKKCYRILLEEGGIPDGIWIYEDLGYRDRLFCSPAILRDLIFPYYKEMVDFFHSYNLPVILHSCGYQAPMIPLAIEAGFDALNPMEAKAGNDIFAYAETYGDQLVFVGGLDARVLESGDRPAIRKAVIDLVQGMRERNARFVYGSDHSLSTNIDYDDFCYSLEVYREVREG